MKFKFLLLLLLLVQITVLADNKEYSRTVHQAYTRGNVISLNIINKYGSVVIGDMGGDSVTIDVIIKTENAYESKAEYLMKQIKIDIRRSGRAIYATTRIGASFKSQQKLSIDYRINIPEDKSLEIVNEYGNVSIKSLKAQGKFNISYGNITTGNIESPDSQCSQLSILYGKADMGNVKNLTANLKYSKLFLQKAEGVDIKSENSILSADEIVKLNANSSNDAFSINKVGIISSVSKNTRYNINVLQKKLVLNNEYGSVNIKKINNTFETIDINNVCGGIKIGLSENSYKLEVECSDCIFSYPQEHFTGNCQNNNHKLKLTGQLGNGTAIVHIASQYGNVKLTN